jgi:hypothetical protein
MDIADVQFLRCLYGIKYSVVLLEHDFHSIIQALMQLCNAIVLILLQNDKYENQ